MVLLTKDVFEMLFPRVCIDGKKVRLIELFGGIGSQSKAFELLHKNYPKKVIFEHQNLVEIDKYCVKSYNAIHNTNFLTKDIKEIKGNDLKIEQNDDCVYIMTYSFPCQDISCAGRMKGFEEGSNTRSSLLWEVVRILRELSYKNKPYILLMENVPTIESKQNIDGFKKLQTILKGFGYTNYIEQLNLKN